MERKREKERVREREREKGRDVMVFVRRRVLRKIFSSHVFVDFFSSYAKQKLGISFQTPRFLHHLLPPFQKMYPPESNAG